MEIQNLNSAVQSVMAERDDVLAAYIYGSMVEGNYHEKSDIDIAILMSESSEGMVELEIASEIEEFLETSRDIDVRLLNGSDLRFKHQVLKNGERIYTGDSQKVIEFEESFYTEYLDKKPFIEEFDRIRRKRMKT